MIDSHDNRTTNAAQWFWKVDPKFGAWVCRTIKRAEQAKQDINAQIPGVHIAVAIIREYLETVYPGNWKGIQSASEGPVRLDDEILSNAIDFARFELIPKWKGWGKAAECLDLAKGGPAVPSATEQGSAPKLNEAKTSRRADSRSSGQGLFD
jgi:hypothetical protein